MNAGKYKDLRSTVLAAFAIFCMDDGRRLRMTRRRCIHMHACVKVQKNQPRCCLDLAMHGVFHSSVDMCNSGNETKVSKILDSKIIYQHGLATSRIATKKILRHTVGSWNGTIAVDRRVRSKSSTFGGNGDQSQYTRESSDYFPSVSCITACGHVAW